METFNQDPKPGRLVLPLVLVGMIATTYTFVNRVATNNDLDLSVTEEEVVTDIFGEQVVLTGGIPSIIKESFNVLLEAGYSPIVAWFVCYYEVKSIIMLLDKKPIISALNFDFWKWVSNYYICSLGDILKASLPSTLLLEGESIISRKKFILKIDRGLNTGT